MRKFNKLYLLIVAIFITFTGHANATQNLAADSRDHPPAPKYSLLLAEESANKFGIYNPISGEEVGRVMLTLWPHEIAVSGNGETAYVSNFGLRDYDLTIGYAGNSISIIDILNSCEIDRLFVTYKNENYWAPHAVKVSKDNKLLYVNAERVQGSRYPDPAAILGQQQTKMLVFDLGTKQIVRAFAMPEDHPEPHPSSMHMLSIPSKQAFPTLPGMHNFEFSPDGKDIWYFSGKTGISRISATDGTIIASMTTDFNGAVRGLSFNEDGTILVSATNEVSIVDPNPLPPKILLKIPDLGVTQLLYSRMTPDCKYILAPAVWEGQVLIIDVAQRKVVKRLVTGIDPVHILISPDNKFAYVSHGRSNWATEIDLATIPSDKVLTRRITTSGGPNGIAFGIFPQHKPDLNKIKLGACLPFTGEYAVEGRECRLGLQLWQDTINAAGGLVLSGKKFLIDIEYKDTFSSINPHELERTTTEFLDENKDVIAMVGTYPSVANLPVGTVVNDRKLPFLTSTGREPSLFEKPLENVFGISPIRNGDLTGTLYAIWESVSPKPRTVILLSSEYDDSLIEVRATAECARRLDLQILKPLSALWRIDDTSGAVVLPRDVAMNHAIATLKGSYPDLLLVASHRQESVDIVRACAKNNFTPGALAFNSGITITYFKDNVGRLGQSLFGSLCWSEGCVEYAHDRFVTSADFQRKFYETYSEHPSELAAGFAASGVVLEEAFRTRTSDQTLSKSLEKVNLETFYGPVAFGEKRVNTRKEIVTIQFGLNGSELREDIVWPPSIVSKTKPIWPFPGWN